nr:hypothetical protein [Sphaerisporangium rubeum]
MSDLLSSLLATVLSVGAGWVAARWLRELPVLLLGWLTGLGKVRVHRGQRKANDELPVVLSRARWVKVLAGRGNEITRDGFGVLWDKGGDSRLEFVEILLPDPSAGAGSWLSRRELEMRRVDPGFTAGLLADQVCLNAVYIQQLARRSGKVRLRFYDLPNLQRVILTDEVAYLTVYRSDEHGRNSPCLVAHRPGPLYDYAENLFAAAWDSGVSAEVR